MKNNNNSDFGLIVNIIIFSLFLPLNLYGHKHT